MTARISALILATALLGFLFGARALGGPAPLTEVPSAAGERDRDALRGSFWRPAGSLAVRPAVRLEPSAWRPAERPRTEPGTLVAVRGLTRLAALD